MRWIVCTLLIFLCVAWSDAQKKGSKELEIMKTYMGNDRRTIFSENINLNILQLRKFWPIFEWYEDERANLAEKRLINLQKYLSNPYRISDIEVDLIHNQIVSINKKLNELQERMYDKLKEELGVGVAMRFFQIETSMDQMLCLELAKKNALKGIITQEEQAKIEEEKRKQVVE